jgi:VanZ family protein
LRFVRGTSKPWLLAAVAWTAAILAVNSFSVSDPTWRPPFAGADKITHVAMYAVCAFAWRRAIHSRSHVVSWSVMIGVAALGVWDEWHQLAVPGRSADVFDWLSDLIGAALGIAAWRLLFVSRDVHA